MNSDYEALLKAKLGGVSYEKLIALNNKKLYDFVGYFVKHCNPASLYVCDDSKADEDHIRKTSLEKGEEHPLAKEGQTIHWDGYGDQARDKVNTRFMAREKDLERMKVLNSVEYNKGLNEITEISENIMEGKDAVLKLFCEGPAFSEFTRPCAQITDSWYVAHSEQILYRPAYAHFMEMEDKDDFFRFIHSAGKTDDRGCSVNLDKRRIYMDTGDNIVYSMNAQYAGNSVGLKKHSMRLAINQSGRQGWLCEHMFLMSVQNEEKDRSTCFAGAFPSACGKTSTAMIPGEKIIGDDIAYFRNIDGEFRAVNVEQGIFGIIKDVNADDDPLIFENLNKPQEIIFSNVLRGPDNNPYWLGMEEDSPSGGSNHSGEGWFEGKKDDKGNVIGTAHGNARYTMRLDSLANFDAEGYSNKKGVAVEGILYGGRDSDTTVPVEESNSWDEGIVLKACTLESETTSATLGAEGVRNPSPMANLDFVSYPLGEYIGNNLKFIDGMKNVPKIYATNYFLKSGSGDFCSSKLAKKVWLHWAEGRIHGEYDAYVTPTGKIPYYKDLKNLFAQLLNDDYREEDYNYQFSFRCDKWISKLERAVVYFRKMDENTSSEIFDIWTSAIDRVKAAKERFGGVIKPGDYRV